MTPKERETLEDEWGDAVAVIAGCPGPPPAEAIERLVTLGDAIRAALRETRETPAGLWNTGLTLPPEQDDDIPKTIRAELLECATSNGRISYWYLCHLWRRGRRVGRDQVVAVCFECGPVTAWDEDGCCLSCGDDLPNAHMKPEPVAAPPTGEAGALREALRDLAGTIVAICDSGNTNLAHLACMDNSPLVGECRSILAVMAGAEPHTAKEAALAAALAAPVPAALAAPVPAAPPDLVAQRDRLQMTLMRLVGVSTRTELEEMEAVIRSLPGIDEDKSAALDAIHALLAYPLPPKEPTR